MNSEQFPESSKANNDELPAEEAQSKVRADRELSRKAESTTIISVHLPPGGRVRLTLESDDGTDAPIRVTVHPTEGYTEVIEIKPGTVHIEPIPETPPTLLKNHLRTALAGVGARFRAGITTVQTLAKRLPWSFPVVLFGLAILLYLAVRFWALPDFPIYFFTDEAVQTTLAADLVRDGFRNPDGFLLPTYFRNGYRYSLSVSVYAQILPYLIFGKSIWVTRAVSVLISLLAAVSVGLILRNVYRLSYWWAATLLLSMVPAWFLHSRTAFETVISTSFYAGFLYFYMRYRTHAPQYLYAALGVGALAFYAYTPAQMVMLVTGSLLLVSDFRYHWQHRKIGLRGMVFLLVLILPYLRFHIDYPLALDEQFRNLSSYWVQPIPLPQKLETYGREYLYGMSPAYWYFPNDRDLVRHLMKGYGHIQWYTLPFALLGLGVALRKVRDSGYRTVILSLLAAPTGAALVQVGITRSLFFIIPATILTAIGLSTAFRLVRDRFHLPVRGDRWLAVATFAFLAAINISMTRDALVNGPTWYQDYGLGGMQYGAHQVFGAVKEYLDLHPNANVMVSPTWSNGTTVVARFFLDDPLPIQLGSIEGHMTRKQPLTRDNLFVITPIEYDKVLKSQKFTDIQVEQTIPYPNGLDGFYFVRLSYSEEAEDIFAREQAERRKLNRGIVSMDGQTIEVLHSHFDNGDVWMAFDGDDHTLVRTEEANPAVFELNFPEPRVFQGISVVIGSIQARITVHFVSDENGEPVVYSDVLQGSIDAPEVSFDFTQPVKSRFARVEVEGIHAGEPAHIHVWEIKFR